jgi:sugar O-acyltransferase (sialic acid O-acetyltransferase NeuD family)
VRFVLYGVSTPQASELAETARRLGWEIAAAVRNMPELPVPAEIEATVGLEELNPELLALPFAVPQTLPAQRYRAMADARRVGFKEAVTLLDPSATVAATATLGQGSYVAAATAVGAGAVVGEGVLLNRSSSIGHHVQIGDYVSSGPGVVIAGSCRIARGTFVGAGAVLAPELNIGEGALIGAGAVVIRDVAAREVVAGNPAQPLREEQHPSEVPWG